MIAYLFLSLFLLQDDIPYLPEENFTVKFEFSFRKRSDSGSKELIIFPGASTDHTEISPLPHIKALLEVLRKDSLAVKLKIVRDNSVNVTKRKIEVGEKVVVFSAFVDDIIDQIQGYQHTIYFLDKKGVRLTKIVIEFDEDGFYSVNGNRRGKI